MSRVAIVGSRRRTDRTAVEAAVAELPAGTVVVSGGCRGVDTWAAAAARSHGLAVVEHRPDTHGIRNRGVAAHRYHDRNRRIAEDCDRMIAFPASDRTGGTENAMAHARRLGKPIEIR
jgi:hypothetical protein